MTKSRAGRSQGLRIMQNIRTATRRESQRELTLYCIYIVSRQGNNTAIVVVIENNLLVYDTAIAI